MKTRNKKMVCIAAALLFALFIWLLWGNTALEVNSYVIQSDRIPEAFSGYRIVQVSDLHNAEFGEGNGHLLSLIEDQSPDIVVITGDLVDSRNTDIEIALEFVRAAVKIAPVYYVTGNHEARIAAYPQLKTGLEQAGVTVLENEKRTLERAGETVTLMGVDDPGFKTDYLFGDAQTVTASVLDDLMDENDGYTILLSHRPELFTTYTASGVDLVFTGHAHGGQFRIPYVGGLVAPNQGFFPEYDAGLYTAETTNMMVSRGVGNSIIPLRINNRPELIVVQLEFTS